MVDYCEKNQLSLVLKSPQGKGCIDELYSIFIENGGFLADMKEVYALDKDEKF